MEHGPPSLVRSKVDCTVGVARELGRTWSSSVTWQRGRSLICEHLGVGHADVFFAAVAHDMAACWIAFNRQGDRGLEGLQQAPRGHLGSSGGRGDRRPADAFLLNFPLDSYAPQAAFWAALNMPFGDLVLELRSSRGVLKKASAPAADALRRRPVGPPAV